ncbi:hypothetical protein DOK_13629 [gamma proteobacterium BDW918]|jgi:hypothetical protein|uniref:DUF4124 domain-containing protein n=1 Tax=Zhongshania aliphaticivorans TaxID=1470434 RepID=A0A127M806_9GAMM|nr:DUF4124 domain-containing protein [Zhongshania aliphaticivorans]AMO69367.1 hypothetical protein AZF00_14110 [Zhongshania aliphaticivorans]EIF42458.1 hypothetical protein DOK_13629 [gamma proteobacterium BDW918]
MNKTLLIVSLFSTLAVVSLSSYADKSGYYRWSDDEGKIHFTQQPPNGRASVFIKTSSGTSLDSDVSTSESSAELADNGDETIPEKMEVLPPKNPELCTKAKANMQSLAANGARIRISNADGSSRFLNSEEINEQKNRAQEVIKIHCN